MNAKLVVMMGVMIMGMTCTTMARKMHCTHEQVLNTQANTIGISDGDVCYLTRNKQTIRCNSGKIFRHVQSRESALTGTPGYLSGEGYIGSIVSKPSTPGLMGSGKRIDYFKQDE